MKLELHLIQNFAPNSLNRDDTNTPKEAMFGGFRRARISSQSFKRAIRMDFEQHELPASTDEHADEHADQHTVRTRMLQERVARRLLTLGRESLEENLKIVEEALGLVGLKLKSKKGSARPDQPTQYLLFVPTRVIEQLASHLNDHWDEVKKEAAKKKKGKEVARALETIIFDSRRVPALALFGRMIADAPEFSIDGASQFAHAISTHAVSTEFDFYTAVDDLQAAEDAGAGMMGTIGFQSACMYRYAVLDLEELRRNLAGCAAGKSLDNCLDEATAREVQAQAKATMRGFVRAVVRALPSGKQNSMAAYNPPSLVLAVVRDVGMPIQLSNAFAKPIRAKMGYGSDGLIGDSVAALRRELKTNLRMFGANGVRGVVTLAAHDEWVEGDGRGLGDENLETVVASLDDLTQQLAQRAFPGEGA